MLCVLSLCTCSDPTGQPSLATTPVSAWLPIVIIFMMVAVISCGVIMTVTMVWLLRWKLSHMHGQHRIAAGEGTFINTHRLLPWFIYA